MNGMVKSCLFLAALLTTYGFVFLPDLSKDEEYPTKVLPSNRLKCLRNPELCQETAGQTDVVKTAEPIVDITKFVIGEDSTLPQEEWTGNVLTVPPTFRRQVCSNKYLTVNTHTWGRHHNQLQSVMHGLLAAHILNRTFVIGHFRHAKKWYSVKDFYSFQEISKHFCVVDFSDRKLKAIHDVHCMGQSIEETPFGKHIGAKCKRNTFAKAFDNTKFKDFVAKAVTQFTDDPQVRGADLINLSGQLAFYMRPGLHLMSIGYGLLQPSQSVGEEVSSFIKRAFGEGSEFVSIHLRYREGTCFKELETDFLKSFKISDALFESLQEQCKVNHAYTKKMLALSLGTAAAVSGVEPNAFPFPTFLASDHQNKTVEQVCQPQ